MKKIFSLLLLGLLCSIGTMKADVLCSATIPAGQSGTFSNLDGISQTGCTLKWSGLQGGNNVVTVSGVDYYKVGSSSAYVQLELTSGSFQAGDIVTATVTSNGNNKSVVLALKSDSGNKFTAGTVSQGSTTDISYALKAADIEDDGSIKIFRGGNTAVRVAVFSVSRSTETYTVTFNAGTHGTCGTASLTEESASAGVILPTVSEENDYAFIGWFDAASQGNKVGIAGETYYPASDVTLYAVYVPRTAGNNYYVVKNYQTFNGGGVVCDDISMVFISEGTFNTAATDSMIYYINANYLASINSGTNGWGVEFTPEEDGILSVGVIINSGKVFSLTNASSFFYLDKDKNSGIIEAATWSPTEKFYGIISINVVAGTSYKFSVLGSKLSFYGFEFMPNPSITLGANGWSTFAANFNYTVSGATVYKAAANDAKTAVVLTEVAGAVVPANEGIILKGTQGATATIALSNAAASEFTDNELVGTLAATAAPEHAYVISTNGNATAFNPCEAALAIPAHKAYMVIDIPTPSEAPIRIEFSENNATNIEDLKDSENIQKFFENGQVRILREGVVYDATGRVVR